MTRVCDNCGFENNDEYDYCAKCGNPLVEGLKPKQIYIYQRQEPEIDSRLIILSYIVTIFLSWSGFIVGIISKHTSMAAFTFFGFFLPFYLVQSPVPKIKRHGFILLAISLIGVFLSFYVMFK